MEPRQEQISHSRVAKSYVQYTLLRLREGRWEPVDLITDLSAGQLGSSLRGILFVICCRVSFIYICLVQLPYLVGVPQFRQAILLFRVLVSWRWVWPRNPVSSYITCRPTRYCRVVRGSRRER